MSILDRLATLLRSTAQAALDRLSDPGREVDLLFAELEEQLRRARLEVRDCLAEEKRQRQRLETLSTELATWKERAERAVAVGDESLAKQALERRAELEQQRSEADRALAEQGAYVDQLTAALRMAEARVGEVKGRRDSLKAEARARAGQGLKTSAFDDFDKVVSAVDAAEAEVLLDDELAAVRHQDVASQEAERRLDELDRDRSVEDRLAALKRRLGADEP